MACVTDFKFQYSFPPVPGYNAKTVAKSPTTIDEPDTHQPTEPVIGGAQNLQNVQTAIMVLLVVLLLHS